MAKKRKAPPKAGLRHGEHTEKRREMASAKREVKPYSGYGTVPGIAPLPSPNGQRVESVEEPPCPLELLTGPRNIDKVNKIFDHLIAYYQRQIVAATGTGTSHIFRDLRTIKLCLAKLFSDRVELKCTLENLLGKDKIQAYHAWRLRYEMIWAAPAIAAIQKRFMDLNELIGGQTLGRAELICFEFAKDLESLAMEMDSGENASLGDWDSLVPRLVSVASLTKAAHDFEQEYLAFQDQAYANVELTRLWLLVWRTLKAVKLPLPKKPEEASLPGQQPRIYKIDPYAIERLFFESDGHPSPNCTSLWNFLQRGDVNDPPWIEEYVSKYCNHIAKCYNENEKYCWQFSTTGSKPVSTIIISKLQRSNQQSTPCPEWNVLLYHVVLRLNHLLGERKAIKRWWRDEATQNIEYLDVNKCSTGMRERSHGQSTNDASTTDSGSRNKENRNDASDRPSGGAANNGGQDGEGSGDHNSSDRRSAGKSSKSSTSTDGSSSYGEDQENKPPHADNLPTATKADVDAVLINSTSPGSRQLPYLGPADDETAPPEVERLVDEFSSSVPNSFPAKPMASSSSSPNPSDQENAVPLVDTGSLATRVLPSAFPYVNYPLAETRASERAMSMQIAREMRQRGIATSGPHVEDVQNIVPRPLRLVPRLADDVFAPSRSPSVLRRSIGALGRLFRPPPSLRPEPLPSLPARGSPRRPTPSPLTANRDGTSGVQRARDRGRRLVLSGSSRVHNASFTPQRSWVRNTLENLPWDSSNQVSNPAPNTLQDMPSVEAGDQGQWRATHTRDTTAGPPSQSSGIFIDRNTTRYPISPTPEHGRGRTRETIRNITARTVQGSPNLGASTPSFIQHPGDGLLVEAGPYGDRENDVPPWQWIPEDNPYYRAFLEDDRARINRGDAARLAAHGAIDSLYENQAGHAIMMEIYQLLRAQYEWPLTRKYRFPQHVPGYYRPPVHASTPPGQRYRPFCGGAGDYPGYLNGSPPGQPGGDDNHRAAPASATGSDLWFSDRRPDLNLLNRAMRPRSSGSWNGVANNLGNQDFDLYSSAGDAADRLSYRRGQSDPDDLDLYSAASEGFYYARDQSDPDQQEPRTSLGARREILGQRREGVIPSSQSSSSALSLLNPSHPGQPTGGQRAFIGGGNGFRQRNNTGTQGSASLARPTGPTNPGGRRASVASSFGWPNRSQDAGNEEAGNPATPTRELYMRMTVQQLREEITHRGGNPWKLRQRKQDLVQALLDYDANGNLGNGAQKRRHVTAQNRHPMLSPRELRPRAAGKVVRKK